METISFIIGWIVRSQGNREIHGGGGEGGFWLVLSLSEYYYTDCFHRSPLEPFMFALERRQIQIYNCEKNGVDTLTLHRNYVEIHNLQSLPRRRRKLNLLPWTQDKFWSRKWKRNEKKPENFLHFRYKEIPQKERGDGVTYRLFSLIKISNMTRRSFGSFWVGSIFSSFSFLTKFHNSLGGNLTAREARGE